MSGIFLQIHSYAVFQLKRCFKEGKINVDELITREVTLDTLVEDGFEELIKNPVKHIKVLIRINGGN